MKMHLIESCMECPFKNCFHICERGRYMPLGDRVFDEGWIDEKCPLKDAPEEMKS